MMRTTHPWRFPLYACIALCALVAIGLYFSKVSGPKEHPGSDENVNGIIDSKDAAEVIKTTLKNEISYFKQELAAANSGSITFFNNEISRLRNELASNISTLTTLHNEIVRLKQELATAVTKARTPIASTDPNLSSADRPFLLVDKDVTHYGFQAVFQGQPPTDKIVSKMANQFDLTTAWANAGLQNTHLLPNIWHRKQWELSYIQLVLNTFGMIKPGKKALVFAVGQEPLVSYFAKQGISVHATDAPSKDGGNWASTGQWSNSIKPLLKSWANISEADFAKLVTFEPVDMNNITPNLLKQEYDFIWTTCSVEHVGSITKGQEFIKNSLKALKPGGVAVHTTEFNVLNLDNTDETGATVLWRKKDVEALRDSLCNSGVRVFPLHFGLGEGYFDVHPDTPPYKSTMVNGEGDPNHIKLKLGGHITTSYAIVLQVPEKPVDKPCETDVDVVANTILPS